MSHVKILSGFFFFVVLLLLFLCLVFISPEKLFHKEGIEAKYRPRLTFVQPCNKKKTFFHTSFCSKPPKEELSSAWVTNLAPWPVAVVGEGWVHWGAGDWLVLLGSCVHSCVQWFMAGRKWKNCHAVTKDEIPSEVFGSEKQDEDFKLFPNLALDLGNQHIQTLR